MRCEICGKTAITGYNVSHSKRHTKRVWSPNIQWTRVAVGDSVVRLRACTRCMRTMRKSNSKSAK